MKDPDMRGHNLMTWTTDPPRFAEYVNDVRITRAGPLLYVYVNLAVKRLSLCPMPFIEGKTLVIECWTADPESPPLWPEPWPDVPPRVSLQLNLGPGEAHVALAEAGRYSLRALVVLGSYEGLIGETEVQRGEGMPDVYSERMRMAEP